MARLLIILRYLGATLVRVASLVVLTGVSVVTAAAQVLNDDKAPKEWWTVPGLTTWFGGDPVSASLLLAGGLGSALGVGLTIFQVFFSRAGQNTLRQMLDALAASERRILGRMDAHHAEHVQGNQVVRAD